MFRSALLFALLLLVNETAFAQAVTVQQPIIGGTRLSTGVMVPDRGRVFLGGRSAAESSRSRYGFSPWGSSLGMSRSAMSVSASVWIIDLHEMDEAILNSGSDRTEIPEFKPSRGTLTTTVTRREPALSEMSAPADKAAKFEQLARKAESDGKLGVARLHWQMAARYGSQESQKELEKLASMQAIETSTNPKR